MTTTPLPLNWLADFAARCSARAATLTHLSPRLISDLAHASSEGMDLLEARIEQLIDARVKAALLERAA